MQKTESLTPLRKRDSAPKSNFLSVEIEPAVILDDFFFEERPPHPAVQKRGG